MRSLLTIVSDQGFVYSPTFRDVSHGATLASISIVAGDTVTGFVVFEVPDGINDAELFIDTFGGSDNPIEWKVP